MTSEQFGGILRAILSAVGGYFVGKGWIDGATATAISGGIVTVAVAVWSVWSKKPA